MSKYSEIVLGHPCVRPLHFNKYEFCVQFCNGHCDMLVVETKIGLATANRLEDALGVDGEIAYVNLKDLKLEWPVKRSGEWADITSFDMYYHDYKGVKQHVILK